MQQYVLSIFSLSIFVLIILQENPVLFAPYCVPPPMANLAVQYFP